MLTRFPIIMALFGLALTMVELTAVELAAAERPNVVWILSEDNSMHFLRLYGNPLGQTPAIEQLAGEGITFRHAFSCAPVCSVARTTLMSGMLAPRVGSQFHRRTKLAQLPDGADLFPAYLRRAGYYTTNNSKKDYNVVEGDVWDESSRKASWRNRPTADTPFFHMQTTALSHESSLHFPKSKMKPSELQTDPSDVEVFPYHPDTPTFRFTYARYYDRMRAIDAEVAKIVAQLQADQLLDNTIIFYFGDHGGVLPRSKGYVYESGLHVPLVVRVPPKWRERLDVSPGMTSDGFVNFTDFGPTVLELCHVEIPHSMDGRSFLGEHVSWDEVESRNTAFGYADRFDEKYDLCRSLRKGKFKYIRNYQAFNPDGLQNNYRYIMLAYKEWRQLYRDGQLSPVQSQFFEPRAAEALYDLEHDPHEVHNLAADPQYAGKLKELRADLQHTVKSLPDLSFFPESVLYEHALPDAAAFGQKNRQRIERLIDVADLALLPFEQAKPKLRSAINSDDPWERYWGLIVCSCFGERAQSLIPEAEERLTDDTRLVRVRAAEFLGLLQAKDPRPVLMDVLKQSDSMVETLLTMNSIVLLRDHGPRYKFQIDPQQIRSPQNEVTRRIDYLTGNLKK